MRYIIASVKPWHKKLFSRIFNKNKKFILIEKRHQLNYQKLKKINPRYIFFPHWSFKVNNKILSKFNCIGFHETNLPYGRGGSPIQNLIIRDKKSTSITAFRMTDKLDSGPYLLKKKLVLKGSAQVIYEKSAVIVFDMIRNIIKYNYKYKKQRGKPTIFKRLKDNNLLTKNTSLRFLYNKIRMLDAETYPKAFIKIKNIKFEFYNVKIIKNSLKCKVTIKNVR